MRKYMPESVNRKEIFIEPKSAGIGELVFFQRKRALVDRNYTTTR